MTDRVLVRSPLQPAGFSFSRDIPQKHLPPQKQQPGSPGSSTIRRRFFDGPKALKVCLWLDGGPMWCHQRQTAPPLDARTWVESPNMMAKQSFGQFVSSDQEGRRDWFPLDVVASTTRHLEVGGPACRAESVVVASSTVRASLSSASLDRDLAGGTDERVGMPFDLPGRFLVQERESHLQDLSSRRRLRSRCSGIRGNGTPDIAPERRRRCTTTELRR